MALDKVTYVDDITVIHAQNLNDIQDEVIAMDTDKQDVISDLSAIRKGAALGATSVQAETDPTVPSWAKASTKPSYTASEITNGSTTVASDLSALKQDLSGLQATALYVDTEGFICLKESD